MTSKANQICSNHSSLNSVLPPQFTPLSSVPPLRQIIIHILLRDLAARETQKPGSCSKHKTGGVFETHSLRQQEESR